MPKATAIGVDTPFLVAHTLLEHPGHEGARRHLSEFIGRGALVALCPVVINEFLHVVTDPRRFERPLSFSDASRIATGWLESRETRFFPADDPSTRLQIEWLARHRLGRKRIHDTLIAAIYHSAGVETILTTNTRDFAVFERFNILDFTIA